MTEEQLHDITRFEESAAFSELEKDVLRYAAGMTRTPADVPEDLFRRLHGVLGDVQIVELTAAVAHENYRARTNRPYDVQPMGLSEGAFCPLPERPA